MLIAHLPASYLLTKALLARSKFGDTNPRVLMIAGLVASIFPDLDMFYFYLIDMRQHHHHTYWTHLPIFWLLTLPPLALLSRRLHNRLYVQAVLIFSLNILLHLLLDSFVGDIWWLSPFVDEPYAIFTVPAVYGHWLWNFVLHWSFCVELAIIVIAAANLILESWRRDSVENDA